MAQQKVPLERRPRIHICCTGLFSHLPVHAAGTVNNAESVSDYAVVSYTPTLGALLNARRRTSAIRKKDTGILIAAVQQGFQWTPLPYAAEEARIISAVVPGGAIIGRSENFRTGEIHYDNSTKDVLDYLPRATILHMTCHGFQDKKDPLASGFVMRDKILTVEQLMAFQLPLAQFAFLSACETAKVDEAQPDQAVHLASTLLFAGFKSVIGTMW